MTSAAEWMRGPVEKRGGIWGWFETHVPSGRSRFVARRWATKKDAANARRKEGTTS